MYIEIGLVATIAPTPVALFWSHIGQSLTARLTRAGNFIQKNHVIPAAIINIGQQ